MSSTEGGERGKKHPCPDCTCCQWCGDDRCSLCRRECNVNRKLSLAEQIELFESLNRAEEDVGGSGRD